MENLRNKVAESGIITLDPAKLAPLDDVLGFDLRDFLWHGMVLKEKEFREQLKAIDWSAYRGRLVAVYCSTDAIVARWAWMLLAQYLQQAGGACRFGTPSQLKQDLLLEAIAQLNLNDYEGERVVIKGCGDESIGEAVYVALTMKLVPVVKSLMYGEPCSTVPVYKKR
jgi:hypothetical protein